MTSLRNLIGNHKLVFSIKKKRKKLAFKDVYKTKTKTKQNPQTKRNNFLKITDKVHVFNLDTQGS